MNKYIIPVCDINKEKVYNVVIYAKSEFDCRDRLMQRFSNYSESDDWNVFVKDLDKHDILLGTITDFDEL